MKFFDVLSSQVERSDCQGCPHNKILSSLGCVDACPKNTLNLMNRQCISRKSCDHENSKYWDKFKFVPSNGICKLVKYCDSIEINENSSYSELHKAKGCQVVQGFVNTQISSESCDNLPELSRAFSFFNKIEEIRDYLKISNAPRPIKNFDFLPRLKMIRGENLESGKFSLIIEAEPFGFGLGLKNFTVSDVKSCMDDCDKGNLTLEIKTKTYGFVVKILNEEFENVPDDVVKFTSTVYNTNQFYGRQLCESSNSQ